VCFMQDFVMFLKKSALIIDGGVIGKRIRVPLTHVRGSSFAKQVGRWGCVCAWKGGGWELRLGIGGYASQPSMDHTTSASPIPPSLPCAVRAPWHRGVVLVLVSPMGRDLVVRHLPLPQSGRCFLRHCSGACPSGVRSRPTRAHAVTDACKCVCVVVGRGLGGSVFCHQHHAPRCGSPFLPACRSCTVLGRCTSCSSSCTSSRPRCM
jgi:hypothetical protein